MNYITENTSISPCTRRAKNEPPES